jgi:hypothetical protein
MKIKSLFCTIFALLFFSFQSSAQIKIFSKNSLEKIKNGNTHVIVNNLNFPHSKEFLEVFKKYWTVTKGVDFIDDFPTTIIPGDSYFSLETESMSGYYGSAAIYLYLSLWTPDEKRLEKKKEYRIEDEVPIAHIQLSADMRTLKTLYTSSGIRRDNRTFKNNKDSIRVDFDGGGHIFNWSPAILKNYLQHLTSLLQTDKKADFTDNIADKTQLQLLRDKTLYCAEETTHKVGTFMKPDTEEIIDTDEVFKGYNSEYKIIPGKDLEKKILTEPEPFYYLLLLRNSDSKAIAVVNAATGELIYSHFVGMAHLELKSADLKELNKAVNRN